MCSSSLAATPLRRCGAAVRMDLISPCCASNSFRAPQPSNSPSLHALQKVMSGWRNCSRFNACLLSGGEFSAMFSKCSRKSSAISGPDKSSIFMSMKNFAPLRIHTTANVRLRSKRLLIRRRRLLTGNRLDPIRCYRAPEADSQFSIQLNHTNSPIRLPISAMRTSARSLRRAARPSQPPLAQPAVRSAVHD